MIYILQEVAKLFPDVIAMKAPDKIAGEWKTWTYKMLQEEVQVCH